MITGFILILLSYILFIQYLQEEFFVYQIVFVIVAEFILILSFYKLLEEKEKLLFKSLFIKLFK